MSKITTFSDSLLRSPLVWGSMACMFLFALLKQGWIDNPLLNRYLLGHPIEGVTFGLFCVAMAALVIRALGLMPQFVALDRELLEPAPTGGQPVADATRLNQQLDRVPDFLQETYLIQRLRAALEYLRRKDSAENLEKHLRHLDDVELDRMSSGYSLVRVIVWAIPSLGFLGTVVGIAAAIGHLSFEGDAVMESLRQVISPLSVAFDTTTVSLALSIPIMFTKYLVERVESDLLERVSERTETELVGRFFEYGSSNDPQVSAVRRMSEQVVRTVEGMSARQVQVLQDTVQQLHQHWSRIASDTGELLNQSVGQTVTAGLQEHAKSLTAVTNRQVESLQQAWQLQAQSLAAATEQQVETLQQALQAQVETLNAGTQQQVELLNHGVAENIQSIEQGIVDRLENIDGVFAKQLDVLGLAVAARTDQLQHETGELIDRLRGGIEQMGSLLVEALHHHGETLTKNEAELARENRQHLSEVEAALGEALVVLSDRQEKATEVQEMLLRQSGQLLTEMQKTLGKALADGAEQHTKTNQLHEQLLQQGEKLYATIQEALAEAAMTATEHQEKLNQQSDILLKVVDATGQVRQLEDALNQNLASLGRTHNLEETMLSLSTAIQLLSARFGRNGGGNSAPVAIQSTSSDKHAA